MKNIVKTVCAVALIALTGCATTGDLKLTTQTKLVSVPIVWSPAPPVIARPTLPHLTISPADDKIDGKVVQSYAASIQALIGAFEEQEKALAQYKTIHDAYAAQCNKTVTDLKTSGFDVSGMNCAEPAPIAPAHP